MMRNLPLVPSPESQSHARPVHVSECVPVLPVACRDWRSFALLASSLLRPASRLRAPCWILYTASARFGRISPNLGGGCNLPSEGRAWESLSYGRGWESLSYGRRAMCRGPALCAISAGSRHRLPSRDYRSENEIRGEGATETTKGTPLLRNRQQLPSSRNSNKIVCTGCTSIQKCMSHTPTFPQVSSGLRISH
jgi:hypothetical protein